MKQISFLSVRGLHNYALPRSMTWKNGIKSFFFFLVHSSIPSVPRFLILRSFKVSPRTHFSVFNLVSRILWKSVKNQRPRIVLTNERPQFACFVNPLWWSRNIRQRNLEDLLRVRPGKWHALSKLHLPRFEAVHCPQWGFLKWHLVTWHLLNCLHQPVFRQKVLPWLEAFPHYHNSSAMFFTATSGVRTVVTWRTYEI